MPRDPEVYLADMLDAVERVLRYTDGMTKAAFLADQRTRDAVLHNLEILGEAAKKVPDARRGDLAAVEWRKMAGMRDMIAHPYFDVDPEIVWDVVQEKLRPLAAALRLALGGDE